MSRHVGPNASGFLTDGRALHIYFLKTSQRMQMSPGWNYVIELLLFMTLAFLSLYPPCGLGETSCHGVLCEYVCVCVCMSARKGGRENCLALMSFVSFMNPHRTNF